MQRIVVMKVERFRYNAPLSAYPLVRIDADNDGAATALRFDAACLGGRSPGDPVDIMLNTPREVDALIEGLTALRTWQRGNEAKDAGREA